jgi:lipoprotein-anchoring transpeptidase ErfK/SrfK
MENQTDRPGIALIVRRMLYVAAILAFAVGMIVALGGPVEAKSATVNSSTAAQAGALADVLSDVSGDALADVPALPAVAPAALPEEASALDAPADIAPDTDLNTLNPAAVTGKWIEVILSQQRLVAWQNGKAVMSSLISSGVSRYPTRRGTFRIYVKYRATRMRGPGYNLPGVPYTMYYSGSYAVHGAYWHNNFGHPMSHGCVNLPVAFSQRLYAWAPIGTPVVIH